MAKGWDKIKDKIEAGAGTARPADWEAMNAKIQAYPTLSSGSGLVTQKVWLAFSLVLIGVSTWWYFSGASVNAGPENDLAPLQQEETPLVEEKTIEQLDAEEADADWRPERNKESRRQESLPITGEEGINEKHVPPGETGVKMVSVPDSRALAKTEQSLGNYHLEKTPVVEYAPQEPLDSEQEFAGQPDASGHFPEASASGSPGEKTQATDKNVASAPPGERNVEIAAQTAPEAEPEKPARDSTELEGQLAEEPLPSSAQAEDFYKANNGFALRSVQLGGKYANNFQGRQAWQVGGDVTLANKQWLINTGLYYGKSEESIDEVWYREQYQLDSTLRQQVSTHTVQEIRSYWVIDSFFAGHWENDTVLITVRDTAEVLYVDTTRLTLRQVNERIVSVSFVEMPILAGYEFQFNRFRLQFMGGLILNQSIKVDTEFGNSQKFGLSGVVQPALHYALSDHYSAYVRSGMRYALKPNAGTQANSFNYDIQLGIAIEW